MDLDDLTDGQWYHNEQLLQQQQENEAQMDFKPKDNQIRLYNNEFKTDDRHPDWTGDGMAKGVVVKVAGWNNTSQNGKDYVKINIDFDPDAYKRNGGDRSETPQKSMDAGSQWD
jgi:uncharacterized protein (DUF736 family)